MALTSLKKERDFLCLLLKISPLQVKALFCSLTPRQTLVLCEILFNLSYRCPKKFEPCSG